MRPAFIYCLSDPRTGEIRYVGKTCDPSHRLQNHIDARDRVRSAAWVKSLRSEGVKPTMEILEEFDDHDDRWQESERFHITYFRFLGMRLTNHELGGKTGHLVSDETKEKMSASAKGRKPTQEMIRNSIASRQLPAHSEKRRMIMLGRKWSDEHKMKIATALTGIKRSKATRLKMSKAQKEWVRTDEMKKNMALAHIGNKHTDEAKEKIRKAMVGRTFSKASIERMRAAARRREAAKRGVDIPV